MELSQSSPLAAIQSHCQQSLDPMTAPPATTSGKETHAQLEQALSEAFNASLRYPAPQRPVLVAHQLIGIALPSFARHSRLTVRPVDFDAEVKALAAEMQEAVNSAARHADVSRRRIADHLLRASQQPGLDFACDENELAKIAEREAEAAAAAANSTVTASRSADVEARDRSTLGPRTALADSVRADVTSRSTTQHQIAPPTLGSRPSAIFPTVIGAFQEQAAKRVAREVDESVIEQAIQAGLKAQGMAAGDD